MSVQTRADLLEAIAALGRKYPEWRLGQLVSNVAGWTNSDVWDIEDEPLLDAIRSHLDVPDRREQRATA
jgi:hypothetical protein